MALTRLHAVSGVTELLEQDQRTRLVAATSFFVDGTAGSNSNSGLKSTAAFATLQGAFDNIVANYDLGGQTVTINVAHGTYAPLLVNSRWVGGGLLSFVGDVASPSSVLINATATGVTNGCCVLVNVNVDLVTFSGFKFTSTVNSAVLLASQSQVNVGPNVDFGACAVYHVDAGDAQGLIALTLPYTISGGAQLHLKSGEASIIGYFAGGTITFTGSPVITYFCQFLNGGMILVLGALTFSGAPAAGCVRYYGIQNGVLFTNGLGANIFNFAGAANGFLFTGSTLDVATCTVAQLPAAVADGMREFVTDSNVAAAGNFGAVVVGGDANTVPVYSSGGVWRIG